MKITKKDKQIISEDISDLKFILTKTQNKQLIAEIEKEIQRLKELKEK